VAPAKGNAGKGLLLACALHIRVQGATGLLTLFHECDDDTTARSFLVQLRCSSTDISGRSQDFVYWLLPASICSPPQTA